MSPEGHSRYSVPSGRPRGATSRTVLLALLNTTGGLVIGGTVAWALLRSPPPRPPATVLVSVPTPPEAAKPLYLCPMHPTVTADHPGDCPLCGMKLVLAKAPTPAEASAAVPPSVPPWPAQPLYVCPMHPTVTAPRAGDCPLCGMKLVLAKAPAAAPAAGTSGVSGLATVVVDPERQQLIGLRTAVVVRGPAGGSWRTVGRVQVDQTRVRKTNVKVEGYVERVFVDFVGKSVTRGEPLFTLYSPSLLAAQSEYLLAIQTSEALGKGESGLASNGEALVASSRRKLDLWDVPAEEVTRLESTRQPSKELTFRSPISGVVTAKNIVQGASVRPGDTPYEITDLGTVWVMADAYETDLARVRIGMAATLTVQSYPDLAFAGKVAFIEPILDAKSRTVKVHVHFPNPKGVLKPEMYGEVQLEGTTHEGLLLPADALVRSGSRDVVFVALGAGKFQPREVSLGAKSGAHVEVLRGLSEGDAVVTRANFLIDSESQFRAALAALAGP